MTSKNRTIIGIAGGSGSGKTTLAELISKEINNVVVVHLDNYQLQKTQPMLNGLENFDTPGIIDWEALKRDLKKLKSGQSILTKHRDQITLEFDQYSYKRIYPADYIVVEGYLLFHDSAVRDILDHLIYLDAPEKTRIKRRTKLKNGGYIDKVLIPMHNKYIEPTKKYATKVLDADTLSPIRCLEAIKQLFYK